MPPKCWKQNPIKHLRMPYYPCVNPANCFLNCQSRPSKFWMNPAVSKLKGSWSTTCARLAALPPWTHTHTPTEATYDPHIPTNWCPNWADQYTPRSWCLFYAEWPQWTLWAPNRWSLICCMCFYRDPNYSPPISIPRLQIIWISIEAHATFQWIPIWCP